MWVAWVGVGGGDDDGMDKLGWWSCKTRGWFGGIRGEREMGEMGGLVGLTEVKPEVDWAFWYMGLGVG